MRELSLRETSCVGGAFDPGFFDCIGGFTSFYGLGGNFCADTSGNLTLGIGLGTPGAGFDSGFSNDLSNYMNGVTVQAAWGDTFVGSNLDMTAIGTGYHFGTPGANITMGLNLGNVNDLTWNSSTQLTFSQDFNAFCSFTSSFVINSICTAISDFVDSIIPDPWWDPWGDDDECN